jgi:hypothetical protein
MTTLITYWTSEVSRLTPVVADTRSALAAARTALSLAQKASRDQSDAVRAASDAVDTARKALAGIPMPADGDPLLVAMSNAIIALRDARVAQVAAEQSAQLAKSDEARLQAQDISQSAALTAAQAALASETAAAAARQIDIDALTTGTWSTLATDAAAALALSLAQAKSRVEGEFPASGSASKDFLKRVRARQALVGTSLSQRDTNLTAAQDASQGSVPKAQRRFDAAWQAVRAIVEAAPRLKDDAATLDRLAALPAPNPPTSYAILTPAQHDELFNATLKSAREAALAKLKTADDAHGAWLTAKAAYDLALQAAIKAHPDLTLAQLNATVVDAEKLTLDTKTTDRNVARLDLQSDTAAYATLQQWFGAVPDALWDALEQLDTSIARLEALNDPVTVMTLLADLATRESELVTALSAQRLADRTQAAADAVAAQALATTTAEQATQARLARAISRSTGAL